MVQDILAFSLAPILAAVVGVLYTVKLVDRARDIRFAVFTLLFGLVAAVETLELWRVITGDVDGYSDVRVQSVQTSLAFVASASVFLVGRVLNTEEGAIQEMEQELKQVRADLHDEREEKRDLENRLGKLEIYDEMVSSVPDMVFAIDESGEFIEVNEAMHRLLGFDQEEFMELDFHRVLAGERAGELTVESEEQKVLVEHEARTKDGDSFPVELHMARLRGKSDVTKGIVGMARDITERKEREQRLGVLNRFFRHNVRNELTVVSGSADLLVENLAGDERKYAQRIKERTQVLEQMSDKARTIGNLLDSRPELLSFDVYDTVERALESFRDDADVSTNCPRNLRVEAVEGLEFAVENLVDNAVEHSGADRPKVEVKVEEHDDLVYVEVHDDGEGIPEHEVRTIVEGAEDPLQHGSGIGLWAVKWIVQRSKGELEFGDSPLGGTKVTMKLNRD